MQSIFQSDFDIMSSITLTLSGCNSNLKTDYYPPIELDGEYVCGLIDFQTYNTIPNVDNSNNCFHFGNGSGKELNNEDVAKLNIENQKTFLSSADFENQIIHGVTVPVLRHNSLYYDIEVIEIPMGSYEIDDIYDILKKNFDSYNIKFDLRINKNTLKCQLLCSQPIDFRRENSIGSLLGFSSKVLEANIVHESDLSVDIFRVNALRLECNITTGAYMNNMPAHTIHEFCPNVPPGYKIIEVPRNVIYLPVSVRTIRTLNINIVDQNNNLVNFRGENITVRIHIKKK